MILARMRLDESNGRKALIGRMLIDAPKGALVTLLKTSDGRYELVAIGADGRRIDTTQQSLLSFCCSESEK